MHRVDEEMRRREEVFERMRRVPAAIEIEADAEREDVEDDGDPECAIRNVGRRIAVIRLAACLRHASSNRRMEFSFRCSTTVVQRTVNPLVGGSNPPTGAVPQHQTARAASPLDRDKCVELMFYHADL